MPLTEGIRAGEHILSEANGKRSRETGVLATGENLTAGTVLGRLTAGGNLVAYNNAGTDGEEVAVGILYNNVDATDADTNAVYSARDTEVSSAILVGLDQGAITDLAALGIITR